MMIIEVRRMMNRPFCFGAPRHCFPLSITLSGWIFDNLEGSNRTLPPVPVTYMHRSVKVIFVLLIAPIILMILSPIIVCDQLEAYSVSCICLIWTISSLLPVILSCDFRYFWDRALLWKAGSWYSHVHHSFGSSRPSGSLLTVTEITFSISFL